MTLARRNSESGVALITALLAVMLMSALMVGMFAALSTDQRSHAVDRDQTQAYAAAQAGLEKLTSGLASLFVTDVSPSVGQLNLVGANPPVLSNFNFTAPGGAPGSGYAVTWDDNKDAQGNPMAVAAGITTGPFTGFQGLITKYTATVTAVSYSGAEVRLRRDIQTVAIPIFQFGVFSDGDLSIFAGDNFSFGGRVHTNGNLFVCEQSGTGTMTFNDRITVVGDVIHNYWSNGLLNSGTSPACAGPVMIPTSATTTRNLQQSPNEGSLVGMPAFNGVASSAPNPNWTTISTGTYRGYIRTKLTGAKRLDLPLVSQGAKPIDLIKRPVVNSNENVANPLVFGQRYFAQASIRILLSDRPADITSLPTIGGGAPLPLFGNWLPGQAPPAGYASADGTHPPVALSPGSAVAGVAPATNIFKEPNGNIPTVAGGSTAATISLAGAAPNNVIPDYWKILPGTFSINTVPQSTLVTCIGKDATALHGCTGFAVAPVAGNTITMVIPAAGAPAGPFGLTITANISAVTNETVAPWAGTGTRLTLNSASMTTAAATTVSIGTSCLTCGFAPSAFWTQASSGNNAAILVQCTGYDLHVTPQQFIGCNNQPGNVQPLSGAAITTAYMSPAGSPLSGGYIKVEKQDVNSVWTDVTQEFLNLGIGAPNQEGSPCADPTPDAILRVQRLRDNGGPVGTCYYGKSLNAYDWWPQALYDPREGSLRSGALVPITTPMAMGGIMQYVSLDVANLKKWLAGTTGATGTQALNQNGYIVYFSDRRGNHDTTNADIETGEYGFEDQINPTVANGTPDGALQLGEDANQDTLQQTYGETPWNNAVNVPVGSLPPYDSSNASRPWITLTAATAPEARVNKVVLFRRALKIVNGGINGGVSSLPDSGLTIVSENPIYVQGNYNATTSVIAEPNRPAAIMGDAITLLSNGFTDANDFEFPNDWQGRAAATTTGWRFAALAGRQTSFPFCGAACGSPGDLFGTDGGTANFLHLMEDWSGSGVSLNYKGSLISLATSRQATGAYKFPQTHIYNGGVRNVSFDTDFLDPTLLPPGTPMFRDVNTLKFRQILRPNQ